MNRIFLFVSLLYGFALQAQDPGKPFIKLTDPLKELNTTVTPKRFIVGSTCKSCSLTINDTPITVYPTGAFAYACIIDSGKNEFVIRAKSATGKAYTKKITYLYTPPVPEKTVSALSIESIQVYPSGNLLLSPGDKIGFRVKAFPGSGVSVMNGWPLYELPDSITGGIRGIYQGEYTVQREDGFYEQKISAELLTPDRQRIRKELTATITVMTDSMPNVAISKGRLAHLLYGLGDDRLGGAKMGYIDSLVRLQVIGKVNDLWKVQLAPSRTAYIPEEHVSLMPKGVLTPKSLTGKIRVYSDSLYDYVELQLFNRLPYQSMQQTNPSAIFVDLFGATGNTNWIDQLSALEAVSRVDYEQIADEIFRVKIYLSDPQHWGHSIYYKDQNLVIRVRPQPKSLDLRNLLIAVDAGHGGKNTGAVGPTGAIEKDITLALSLKLQQALLKEGARVIMTREKEMFYDNKERILLYRDSLPDLLLSIHLNSSADPLTVGGTSTFYRYPGFRPLSKHIYKRLLELGLRDYGNNGSFNFMLNSPTEYPNALLELLFLSNPAEEMLILDPVFQDRIVEKIVLGLKDFLQEAGME